MTGVAFECIAFLDDDEAVRRALTRLIRSLGFEAQAFATGDEFLSSPARREPDCLVLDLHMPHLSGFDVQERLARPASGSRSSCSPAITSPRERVACSPS